MWVVNLSLRVFSGKRQQLIPIMRILLLPCFDLGGETVGEGVAEGVKAVEDGDNAGLLFEGGERDFNLVEILLIQLWLCAT